MEVLERPAVATTELDDELNRFKGVVAKRRLPSEFIALFQKLKESDMFSAKMKPSGFAFLVEASATKVPDHLFAKLLDAIEESGAAGVLFAARGRGAEDDFKAMVRRWFELTPLEEKPQLEVFLRLERMGIAEERGSTLDMALRAGMAHDLADRVCDLTFAGYYPGFAAAFPDAPMPTPTPQSREVFDDAALI